MSRYDEDWYGSLDDWKQREESDRFDVPPKRSQWWIDPFYAMHLIEAFGWTW